MHRSSRHWDSCAVVVVHLQPSSTALLQNRSTSSTPSLAGPVTSCATDPLESVHAASKALRLPPLFRGSYSEIPQQSILTYLHHRCGSQSARTRLRRHQFILPPTSYHPTSSLQYSKITHPANAARSKLLQAHDPPTLILHLHPH